MHIFINRDLEIRLSEGSNQYKQFWKQICKFGEYVNPNGNGKMILDKKFADEMVGNFKSGKYGVVPVPLGHPKDSIELAELNRGEVKDLKITDDGIDALIEIRDDDMADKIEKRLIPDASMGFSEDYLDNRTGEYVGAFLKHVGLVADPYIKGMDQFIALSESSASILFSDKEIKKGEEMNLVKIKNDRDFDIEVQFTLNDEEKNELIKAGEEIEVPEDQAEAVKKQIEEAEKPEEAEDESEAENTDERLADENQEDDEAEKLRKEREEFEKEKAEFERKKKNSSAEKKFDQLLSEGKVVPAMRENFIALSSVQADVYLSDETSKPTDVLLSELFEKMPDMRLSDEDGENNAKASDEVELTDEDKKIIDKFGLSVPERMANLFGYSFWLKSPLQFSVNMLKLLLKRCFCAGFEKNNKTSVKQQ